MKIEKIKKVDTFFVKNSESHAVAVCSQETYKEIGEMLKGNQLKNKKIKGTINYDENGNWTVSLNIKVKK